MTNRRKSVLYVGVTANLKSRIWEHKTKVHPKSFTARYDCDILIYYKGFQSIEESIKEEKRIKGGNRKAKLDLIFEINPLWKDLYDGIED